MPRQFNLPIYNFNKGIVTEASPLNFPEGASLDESNFTIVPNGNRERRLGLDFEEGFSLIATGLSPEEISNSFVSYHDWPNVMNSPEVHLGVVAIGNRLYFFDMYSLAPSSNLMNQGNYLTIPMSGKAAIKSTYINGYLVLTCPAFSDPVYLEYNQNTDTVSYTSIQLKIRDLQGVDDSLELRDRPPTLSDNHKYNLINQGWTSKIETVPDGTAEIQYIDFMRGVGGDSGNATWGGITFYVDEHAPGNGTDWVAAALNNQIPAGCNFPITTQAVTANRCLITFDPRDGQRPQYDFTAGKSLWNDSAVYCGTIQDGSTIPYPDVYAYLNAKLGAYPSNADVVSLGLIPDDTSLYFNKFDIDVFIKNTGYLNLGEAPKGHIIIDAKRRNSSRQAVVPGVTSDYDTGSVGVCCGHAGRVFYAGVQGQTMNADGRSLNSHSIIYFTQIITDKTKLERCYQENDPTDQRQFELAAGDGGTIFIPGCSGVTALKSFHNSVLVFSEFGIWEITGGDQPFSATSYAVNKIASLACIAPDSILEVGDSILFWAREGIYSLARNQYGVIETQNISRTTIQTKIDSLPDLTKRSIKGYYDVVKNQARWLYTEPVVTALPPPPIPPEPSIPEKWISIGVEHTSWSKFIQLSSNLYVFGCTPVIYGSGTPQSLILVENGTPRVVKGPPFSTVHNSICRASDTEVMVLHQQSTLNTLYISLVDVISGDVTTHNISSLFPSSSYSNLYIHPISPGVYVIAFQAAFAQYAGSFSFNGVNPPLVVSPLINTSVSFQTIKSTEVGDSRVLFYGQLTGVILQMTPSLQFFSFPYIGSLVSLSPSEVPYVMIESKLNSSYTYVICRNISTQHLVIKRGILSNTTWVYDTSFSIDIPNTTPFGPINVSVDNVRVFEYKDKLCVIAEIPSATGAWVVGHAYILVPNGGINPPITSGWKPLGGGPISNPNGNTSLSFMPSYGNTVLEVSPQNYLIVSGYGGTRKNIVIASGSLDED